MVAPRWRGQNQARHVSFLPTDDEHRSSACENLAQSIQQNFNSFYSYPVIVWKGLGATHRRAVTVITSQLQEPDIFVFQATFEIWKGILSISVKKNMFLFDAKIKAFSKALWCARQKDMQADSEGGLVFSNYQHSFWILLPRQNFNVK